MCRPSETVTSFIYAVPFFPITPLLFPDVSGPILPGLRIIMKHIFHSPSKNMVETDHQYEGRSCHKESLHVLKLTDRTWLILRVTHWILIDYRFVKTPSKMGDDGISSCSVRSDLFAGHLIFGTSTLVNGTQRRSTVPDTIRLGGVCGKGTLHFPHTSNMLHAGPQFY